ncbi:Hsp20 family protein [Govanella unica]|uniref:Hsp20 family protein n=1 Tax=Govanella unica TaxID=2975056 RepID=UPI0023A86947
MERIVERIAKAGNDSYPPFNIEHVGADRLRISLAVAGFAKPDLSITLEDNILTIRGRQPEDSEDDGTSSGASRLFLHRGIATRQFQRRFVLERGVEITGAVLKNGLLEIDLRQPPPSSTIVEITITDD